MRVVAVLIVAVVMLAAAAGSTSSSAATRWRPKPRCQWALAPSWSPVGKEIVFTAWKSANGERYYIVRTSSRPGRALRVVQSGKRFGETTAWSHGWILFTGYPGGILHSVAARGGESKEIAFRRCLPSGSGGKRKCYSASTGAFILSPNRTFAAVTIGEATPHGVVLGIGLVRLNAARPVVVSTPLTEEENGSIVDRILGFSPDGRQLVFSRTPYHPGTFEPSGPAVLMAIRPRGGGAVRLAQSGIRGASLIPNDVQQVKWSHDGGWVAFDESNRLEVVPTSGSSAPRVLETQFGQCDTPARLGGFSWSPSAELIAYDDCSAGPTAQLMLGRPDDAHPTNLLKNRGLEYHGGSAPQWSPDGSRLVFLAHKPRHRNFVWIIRANGHDLTRIGIRRLTLP
jgi:WD40-like Beta Propeller Repeat